MCFSLVSGCSDDVEETATANVETSETVSKATAEAEEKSENNSGTGPEKEPAAVNYRGLLEKITYGKASQKEILEALTQKNVAALTNTMHALNSMRWRRTTFILLDDMWELKKSKYPDIAWDLIEKAPVRIALASTINRINGFGMQEQKTYIREHKNDEHEFHRAQVIVSLGLSGDPADVPYIKEMAAGKNVFVAQSAITSLGLINNPQASNALIELHKKFKDDARAALILEILNKAYDLHPTLEKPEEENTEIEEIIESAD